LYRPRAVSFLTISTPVFTKPRGLTCNQISYCALDFEKSLGTNSRRRGSPRELHADLDGV
jgi:hypothetical protein